MRTYSYPSVLRRIVNLVGSPDNPDTNTTCFTLGRARLFLSRSGWTDEKNRCEVSLRRERVFCQAGIGSRSLNSVIKRWLSLGYLELSPGWPSLELTMCGAVLLRTGMTTWRVVPEPLWPVAINALRGRLEPGLCRDMLLHDTDLLD